MLSDENAQSGSPAASGGWGDVRVRMLASGLGDTCGGPPARRSGDTVS